MTLTAGDRVSVGNLECTVVGPAHTETGDLQRAGADWYFRNAAGGIFPAKKCSAKEPAKG